VDEEQFKLIDSSVIPAVFAPAILEQDTRISLDLFAVSLQASDFLPPTFSCVTSFSRVTNGWEFGLGVYA